MLIRFAICKRREIGRGLIVVSEVGLQTPSRPGFHKPAAAFGCCQIALETVKTNAMPTVAEQLRSARETQKISVEKVAEITKFRADHIRAVENGSYDVFSAQIYVKGFVRTYANLLKLDIPQIMALLDVELGKSEKFREPPPLVERQRTIVDILTLYFSRVDLKKTLIIGGALVIILIVIASVVAWRKNKNSDPLKNLSPGVYQSRSNSGDTLPVPPARR